jgi:protocatechuate 3,4-dioxygenase beta subunit
MKNVLGYAMKFIRRFLFGLLCVILGSPAFPGQSGTQQATSSVEGKVVHESGGQPIRKAIVHIVPTGSDLRLPLASTAESEIDSSEGIEVFGAFSGGEGRYSTATDAEGRFKFDRVLPGSYSVYISRVGYLPVEIKPRGMIISVVEGQNLADLTYKMATAGVVAGKVTDADGDPIPGLMVQAMQKSEEPRVVGLTAAYLSMGDISANLHGVGATNDLGEYRIAGLRAGQYLVIALPRPNMVLLSAAPNKTHPGERLVYAPTYYPGVADEKQASALQVTPGGVATADFTLQTHHAHHVSGIVGGLGNTKGSFILLMSNSGRPQQQALGEGGKFEFPSLEPGTYFVQVYDVPDGTRGEGLATLSVPTPIVVGDSDLTDLVLQPIANGRVKGKFRGEGEDQIDWGQMAVSLMRVPDGGENGTEKGLAAYLQPSKSGVLTDDGSFEIDDVPSGNYQVAVTSPSEKYRDWYLKSLLFAGREVADTGFAASGETTLDVLVSAKGASIGGKVADDTGKPVPNVFVASVPSSGKLGRPDSYQTARSDANGNFILRGMNPGDFTVIALENLPRDFRDADFLQKYGGQGTIVSLSEGEKKTVTLAPPQDDNKK